MNNLTVFENPEFGAIRTVELDGEPWLVGKDVAETLGYTNPQKAVRDHVDEEDRTVNDSFTVNGTPITLINESGLYSLVLSSKLPTARKFRRWVTSEVLPSIRRTGGYNLPKDYPSALRALADTEEKRLALLAENERQQQIIADFEPVKQYVDTILQSKDAVTTTQIAADYGMSAKELNRILYQEGVQHKVNGQWILYKKHMGKGLTVSRTIHFYHHDGSPDTKMNTCWTQKGRMMIHNILTARGIQAVMDRKEGESND